ncbi:MAG TPA: NUDIX domain-containing protein [Pelobium sp.]|nr:NUDIX domain-containing protein [Pelobium sp.]
MTEIKHFNVRVYGLLIDKDKNILVSDEEERGYRYIKFPGGGLEFGEGLADALKREFLEECNLQVEVINHFYTTDFFVASAFGGGQLISVYYLVKPLHDFDFKLASCEYDFEGQEGQSKQCFRMVNIANLNEDSVTFPVDKHIVKLIKEKFL